jgi:hypothetical protein
MSIVAVAVFQILVSILLLIPSVRAVFLFYKDSEGYYSPPVPSPFEIACFMICLAALLIVTAIGLLRLANWARWITLFFATVPVCVFSVAAKLHQREPGFDFTIPLLFLSLWILIPMSFWWWVLFTRKSVRAQFT